VVGVKESLKVAESDDRGGGFAIDVVDDAREEGN
jgi:hypothetical protein